jgi:hypothetical protein
MRPLLLLFKNVFFANFLILLVVVFIYCRYKLNVAKLITVRM